MTAELLPTATEWREWGIDPAWSRIVVVGGHRWHLLDTAPADPVGTIVCVHGNPTWSLLWRSALQRLGRRYRVVAVDQLGMGYSDRTSRRDYAQRVDDLATVIDALEVDGPIVVAGHDWGGAIAIGWAVAHRDRLAGLVLCNTGIAVPAGRRAPWLIRVAASGPLTDLACRRTRTFVDGTIALSRRRLDDATRRALRAPYRSAARRSAIADFVDDVPFAPSDPSAEVLADVAAQLPALTAPVLLAWGATDLVFDDSFALDLAARMPHADLHRFDGAGHLSPLEADVAGVMDTWLTSRLECGDGEAPSAVEAAVDASVNAAAEAEDTGYVPGWAALEARAQDDAVAFVDGRTGERTSFRELHRRVTGTARGLGELGLQPGERVAVLVPPSVDLLVAVYAVWRAGGVTVVADRGLGVNGLGGAVRGAGVEWVVGPPRALAAARALRWAPQAYRIAVGRRAVMGAVATLDDLSRSSAVLPAAPEPDDAAAVLYTSGATGPAKGVRYRHRQLAAQRDALARTYGITGDDRLVAAFAPFAIYGPALGIASTIPDVDVTMPGSLTAEALATACGSVDATIVFASPAALANVARTASGPDSRLDGVRLGLSAGAPVPVATLREMQRLVPSAEWHTPYGMTECLPVVDVSLGGIDRAGEGRGVCVGPPVAGAEVLIAPLGFDANEPVDATPDGETGEVLVRAPWLSDGYDRRWATERDARPTGVDGRRWHRSGDVGHLDHAGRVWIEGRSVHVVHTDHGPVTPVPVEIAAERLSGVRRAAAVGVGPHGCEQLLVVVEPEPDSTPARPSEGLADAELTGAIRAAVGAVVPCRVAAVLLVRDLPVDIRHNTKIDRTLVSRWASSVLSGERSKRPW